jgi:hypothetical protein
MDRIEFLSDLTDLFNKYSIDNEANTADYLLADYTVNLLKELRDLNNRMQVHKIIKPSLETLNYE